jgi:hypothetical protein
VVTLQPAGGGLAPNTVTKSHLAVNAFQGDIEMKRSQSVNSYGTITESMAYIKDGMMYTDSHGQKIKTLMYKKLLASNANSIVDFPKDAVSYESVLDVYGGKQVMFSVKSHAIADYVNSRLSIPGFKDTVANKDFAYKEGKITAVIDPDGNFIECTVEIAFSFRVGESRTNVVRKSEISNIKAGKTEISFPSDLDAYKESKPGKK